MESFADGWAEHFVIKHKLNCYEEYNRAKDEERLRKLAINYNFCILSYKDMFENCKTIY